MVRGVFGLSIQLEAPLQVRIVGMRSFRPCGPYEEEHDQQSEVRIGCLQPELLDNLFKTRIPALAKPFSAFGAEQAVFRYVCATVSTKHFKSALRGSAQPIHGSDNFSCPILRLIKLQRFVFARAWFRLEVINPAYQRRQTHQNGFGASSCFQTENRTAIIEKIKLHITAAAIELVLTFVFAMR